MPYDQYRGSNDTNRASKSLIKDKEMTGFGERKKVIEN